MRHQIWLGALAALALAGCGNQAGDQNAADTTAMADTMAMADTTAMAPGAAPMDTGAMAMDSTQTAVDLTALDNSGVTGQAMLSPDGSGTKVMVTLNAGASGANTVHQGHIHTGSSCTDHQGVAQPLQPITLDASGTGSMTTTVALAADSVMDGNHIILYHEAGGSPGKPVTCGVIPKKTM